jgi:PIN domain nuclease of toxin-antitoxin system
MIVFDTHTWVWFVSNPGLLSEEAKKAAEPLHNDPADRIIIATAMTTGFPLVTKDQKILDYPYVETIW